ncbi:MAG TPA: rod shape-determining protein MreD [Gammaproteobacteria bacterium]|nr:rod shape-determining protein MreD [Gammaproteobacteria bacterium]
MSLARHHGGFVILLSFGTAMLLTIVPLSDGVRSFRPDWVALTLIFWSLVLPYRVSVGSGFLAGLLLDVLTGTLLGQHALALSLVAYLCVRLHLRIRAYPMWQQSLTVLVLLVLQQLVVLWIDSLIGRPPHPFSYWLPSLVGMVLWPLVYRILTALRINFSVS